MKDSWRYQYLSDKQWLFDMMGNEGDTEDKYITMLDRNEEDPSPERIAGVDMIDTLDHKKRFVVESHIWNGLSFAKIGERLNVSKQRAHQIYWEAIGDLKETYPSLASLTLSI